MEKYLSLTVGQLKFIDSFQLTPQGLDKLAKTLGDDEFMYLSESYTSNYFGRIRPSQDGFFSKLSGSPCSHSEYTYATFRVHTCVDLQLITDNDMYKFVENSIRPSQDGFRVHTCVDLQLITDNDMYNFVENSIRGGSL